MKTDQDKHNRNLLWIGVSWLIIVLITLRVKAPLLSGLEAILAIAGILYFAYITFSYIFEDKTSEEEGKQEEKLDKQTNTEETTDNNKIS